MCIAQSYFIVPYFAASIVVAFTGSYYRGKVDEHLKDGVKLCREIMFQPENLSEVGLKYRKLSLRYFCIFALMLLSFPVLITVFKNIGWICN